MDHFGVTREDAHRICDGAGIIIDLTAPKLNYLMQKFGTHLKLQVPPSGVDAHQYRVRLGDLILAA